MEHERAEAVTVDQHEHEAAPVAHGSGESAVKAILASSDPDPVRIAKVVQSHPGERDAIMSLVQTSAGNSFAQSVVAAGSERSSVDERESSADSDKVAALLHRLGID